MQANRNIHLCEEQTPIYNSSRSKVPKTQQTCGYKHTKKTSRPFSLYDTSVDLNSRNNFANLGFFTKTSVPAETIIPWINQGIIYYHSLNRHHNGLHCFSHSCPNLFSAILKDGKTQTTTDGATSQNLQARWQVIGYNLQASDLS